MIIHKRTLRKIVSLFTVFIMTFTMALAQGEVTLNGWNGTTAKAFDGGTGTSTDPYIISTGEQLAYLASLVNANNTNYNSKYYKLAEDIDLSGREWTPIGKGSLTTNHLNNGTYAFKGVFNGNGHTVSNFKITKASTSYIGLFGNVYGGNSSSIVNLNVSDFTINANLTSTYNLAAGGLAATCYGIIESCSVSNGTINVSTSGSSSATCYTGGLLGRNIGGYVTKCYSDVTVKTQTSGTSCHAYAGGFVGYNTSGNILYSYSMGDASSTSEGLTAAAYAGGFAAGNGGTITSAYANGTSYSLSKNSTAMAAGFVGYNTATVITSYATGDVTTVSSTKTGYGGGFVGNSTSDGKLTSCFATGNVNVTGVSNAYTGGFAGLSNGTVTKCYRTTSQTVSGTTTGTSGTPTFASNMTKSDFFTSTTYFTTTWDFTSIWTIGVSGTYEYPTLIAVPHPVNWAGDMAVSYSGGDGSEGAPYEIATAGELALLAANVNSGNTYQNVYFKLTANIDLGGLAWIPIGRGRLTTGTANASNAFCGHFDGGNHTVSNFIIYTANTSYTGLFGIIYGGSVENLKVKDFIINVTSPAGSTTTVGGLAGTNTGTVIGCYASGNVTGSGFDTYTYVGGLVGKNEGGLISRSIAEVQVIASTTAASSHALAGGLTGHNTSGTIDTSYATGNVSAYTSGTTSAAYAGGLTAMTTSDSSISDSYATGTANATSGESTAIAGGFIAHNNGRATNCYSTGTVNSISSKKTGYGGGFVGYASGNMNSCFTTGNVTVTGGTNTVSGRFAGYFANAVLSSCYYSSTQTVSPTPDQNSGTVTTASNLSKQTFYTSTSNFATPWNMTATWTIGEVSGYNYPTLRNTTSDTEPEVPVDDDPNIDPEGWDGTVADEFDGGKGTEAAPYEIATPGQLLLLANEVNAGNSDYTDKYYILTDNIDLNHRAWTPIGKGSQSGATVSRENAFYGSFDGNGYVIENLKINRAPGGFAGLFGSVYGGELENIILNNVKIEVTYSSSSYLRIGAIAGYLDGTLSGSYAKGTVTITNTNASSLSYVGGLVGYSAKGEINGSTSETDINVTSSGNGTVGGITGYCDATLGTNASKGKITALSSATAYVGGIAGYAEENPATNCYSSSEISGKSSGDGEVYVGGLAGYSKSNWLTSYASGDITATATTGDSYAGGLFGYSQTELSACFAVNNVTATSTSGNSTVGGIIGKYNGGALNNCYRSTSQDLDADTVNSRGATATLDNLKSKDFLTDTKYFLMPWDFDTVWQFKLATGYEFPVLKGEVSGSGSSLYAWEGEIATGFDSGSGTAARPYKIANAAQLAYLAYMVNTGTDYSNSSFELTADIDLSESPWVPIGKGTNITGQPTDEKAFCGKFDGNGFTIRNVTVNQTDKSCYGLFGCVYNGIITNLNVENISIDITAPKSGNVYAGGIAGVNYGGWIEFSKTTGSVKVTSASAGDVYAGGITGASYESVVELSMSTASVNATATGNSSKCISGGIAGYINNGEIVNCYWAGENSKAITMGSVKAYAGGISGCAENNTIIKVGYSNGNVTASSYISDSYAGGIVGHSTSSAIESMLSIGDITASSESGNEYGGGITGLSSGDTVTNCYKSNLNTVTANTVNISGISVAPSNFKSESFLTNESLFASYSWDFDNWVIGATEGYEYPTLVSVPHSASGEGENEGNNDITVEISYNNGIMTITSDADLGYAFLAIAAYDGNTMTSVEFTEGRINKGSAIILTENFTTAGADKMKVMFWESAEKQSEIIKPVEIEL